MSTEWITDRLPTEEDGVGGRVLISNKAGEVYTIQWQNVSILHAWTPLPAPYVKPKRWTVEWNDCTWVLIDHRLERFYFVGLAELGPNAGDAAQRIADLFNEVMP